MARIFPIPSAPTPSARVSLSRAEGEIAEQDSEHESGDDDRPVDLDE